MFTIRFQTTEYRPDLIVTLRDNVDGWDKDISGIYENDEWRFELPETRYPQGMQFKFVLETTYWMNGQNLQVFPTANANFIFNEVAVQFPLMNEMVVENSHVQQLFFPPNLNENQLFDVIVIGSGAGGGIVADQCSDQGLNVLVLEAGSYLFPTHVANLPRQHQVGQFSKHVWGLYDEFKVNNYANTPNSNFNGGQAFNLGGRSLFWGGLIPRMMSWELDFWSPEIKQYLEGNGYNLAEDLMNRSALPASTYHQEVKRSLREALPEFNHLDAPVAVQYANGNLSTIPTGMFSTADLLMEAMLTNGPSGNQTLAINLNHVVTQIQTNGDNVTGVTAYDLIAKKYRTYRAKAVVLAAGTIESTKIAQLSNLRNPNNLIGTGITDHPIYFTHFAIPANSPFYNPQECSKIVSQHRNISATNHAYNVVLELGADFNQGRFMDDDTMKRHRQLKNDMMLCEIVFLFNSPLMDDNTVRQVGVANVKPQVTMQRSPSADPFWGEMNALKDQIINTLGGVPLPNGNLTLNEAGLGGVAHEVGTLRMGAPNNSVVNTNLKFHAYNNLYACDLSVFPTSPAANPTLTLAALAIRLADHLKQVVG
ncbi:MAG: GMC family oxidoreductase [Oscillatoriales cyanobacterium C42_A2020_001]|nr:GMC family oxidoreductase [Leptolyngbyaceae cyanobacterium C42_A2020_001]